MQPRPLHLSHLGLGRRLVVTVCPPFCTCGHLLPQECLRNVLNKYSLRMHHTTHYVDNMLQDLSAVSLESEQLLKMFPVQSTLTHYGLALTGLVEMLAVRGRAQWRVCIRHQHGHLMPWRVRTVLESSGHRPRRVGHASHVPDAPARLAGTARATCAPTQQPPRSVPGVCSRVGEHSTPLRCYQEHYRTVLSMELIIENYHQVGLSG